MKLKYDKIIDIKDIGEQESYDLELEHPIHHFFANDICVSNSHSASYALLAMQTIYLKLYYPLEFYSTVLSRTHISKKTASQLLEYIDNIRQNNVEILPIDINKSLDKFTIEGNKIRCGFSIIDGIGDKAISSIIKNRPYKNIYDFCVKNIKKGSKVNKRSIENLIRVNAFQSIEENMAKVESLVALYQSDKKAFENNEEHFNRAKKALVDKSIKNDFSDSIKMKYEFDSIGCNIFFSPFTIGYRKDIINELESKKMITNIKLLKKSKKQGDIVVFVNKIKLHEDKNKNEMAFLSLKDNKGNESDAVCFASTYKYIKDILKENQLYYMTVNAKDESLIVGPTGWPSKEELKNSIIEIDRLID